MRVLLDRANLTLATVDSSESSGIAHHNVDELLKDVRRIFWRCNRRLRAFDYHLAVQLLTFLSQRFSISMHAVDTEGAFRLEVSHATELNKADIVQWLGAYAHHLNELDAEPRREDDRKSDG